MTQGLDPGGRSNMSVLLDISINIHKFPPDCRCYRKTKKSIESSHDLTLLGARKKFICFEIDLRVFFLKLKNLGSINKGKLLQHHPYSKLGNSKGHVNIFPDINDTCAG